MDLSIRRKVLYIFPPGRFASITRVQKLVWLLLGNSIKNIQWVHQKLLSTKMHKIWRRIRHYFHPNLIYLPKILRRKHSLSKRLASSTNTCWHFDTLQHTNTSLAYNIEAGFNSEAQLVAAARLNILGILLNIQNAQNRKCNRF